MMLLPASACGEVWFQVKHVSTFTSHHTVVKNTIGMCCRKPKQQVLSLG